MDIDRQQKNALANSHIPQSEDHISELQSLAMNPPPLANPTPPNTTQPDDLQNRTSTISVILRDSIAPLNEAGQPSGVDGSSSLDPRGSSLVDPGGSELLQLPSDGGSSTANNQQQ